ncbi:DUF2127 domain-containing protein [Corynebacterium felinum]|uniref:Membrane protein n=1 Tax=Corynebacterium felinum TaxID=131318 RepID=A0ABU2B756_9CORY|nr:DUF2127 domain-containing protein [Corynebacterium felinum]MDF5820366.1 DUF2127 domain-containing protein [Corynebacterium felinum]MDR7354438.1 putative membrane protein [Corynebacterium felinum]WJY93807.1 hypothetical protein CFELI_00760 [Corynebacterium felinum]
MRIKDIELDLATHEVVALKAFRATLWFKLILGFFELLLAVVIKTLPEHLWRDITDWLAQSHNPVSVALANSLEHFDTSAQNFIVFYLVIHAVVKTILIVAVLCGRLWAYPLMIAVLVFFIVYQTFDMIEMFTYGMFALTILDIVLIWLTLKEWRIMKLVYTSSTDPRAQPETQAQEDTTPIKA